jgi:hypothetical protein
MGGTDVTEKTRRRVATDWPAQAQPSLPMKPVVLAREYGVGY